MGNTNYFSGILQILDNPKESLLNKQIPVITFRSKLPQIRENQIVSLVFWGNLAVEVKKYYQVTDYILVEGYLSLRPKKDHLVSKELTITGLKVYPFLLKSEKRRKNSNISMDK